MRLIMHGGLWYHLHMMGYGGWGMMGGAGFFGGIAGIVILVDLILVGIWLWQQITKK